MIMLVRAYDKDGFVVAAETYDHDERPVDHRHPLERCRCIPDPLWRSRMTGLSYEYPGHKVTVTQIYLNRKAP